MLSKANRLSRREIELIIKNGKSIHSPLFGAKLLYPSGSLNSVSKASFVASKKLFPLAVTRNKVKRKARESFRKIIKEIKPVNAVIFLKKEALLSKTNDFSLEFLKVFR